MGPCLATAGLLTGLVLAAPQTRPKTISLCTLFEDLRSPAGKMISVRGVLYSGREISALGGSCDTKFITKYSSAPPPLDGRSDMQLEYAWPTALDLAGTPLHGQMSDQLADFQTDNEAVQQVFSLLRRERARLGSDHVEILVTVVGMLRMKDRYFIGKRGDGRLGGDGYGHLGTYPGQVVIKTMIDPEVRVR